MPRSFFHASREATNAKPKKTIKASRRSRRRSARNWVDSVSDRCLPSFFSFLTKLLRVAFSSARLALLPRQCSARSSSTPKNTLAVHDLQRDYVASFMGRSFLLEFDMKIFQLILFGCSRLACSRAHTHGVERLAEQRLRQTTSIASDKEETERRSASATTKQRSLL